MNEMTRKKIRSSWWRGVTDAHHSTE